MFEEYPSRSDTGKLSRFFNGVSSSSSHQEENNFSTIKITEKTDTSFTTQSSQLAVDEPSTILTTSIFQTTTEQYDDGRLSNSLQTTGTQAAEFPTITTTAKDTEEFISASTSLITTTNSQEHRNYVQNTRPLSSSITTTSTTLQFQLQQLPTNPTIEMDVEEGDIISLYNTTTEDTIGIFARNETNIHENANSTTEYFPIPSFPETSISEHFPMYASFLCVIACIGILGNSSVIHLIFKEFQLNIRTNFTNIFALSLAVADLIACTFVAFPASVSMSIGKDPTSGFLCGIQCMANYMTIIASIGTMTIISIDRFISVRWPLHYPKWVTPTRLRTALVTIWIQALIASTHAVSPTKTIEYEDSWRILCVTNWSSSTDSLLFGIFSLAWFILSPGIIIGIANTLLLRHVFLTEERVNPVITLKRQNAFRGVPQPVQANSSASENQNEIQLPNQSRFAVYPVYPERPKQSNTNTWANMTSIRFQMQNASPTVQQHIDEEDREIHSFTRDANINDNCNNGNTATINIQHISRNDNDSVRNTDVSNDQILQCYLAIISLYFVLHFPTVVVFIIKCAMHLNSGTPGGISYFSFICHVIASSINPFLYASLRRDFRKSYSTFLERLPRVTYR